MLVSTLPVHSCVVKVSESVWKEWMALGFSSTLFLSWVYHGGLPWQPQKWPVRALGNVDVQIMTCWKPWTTSLSPAGNWFLYQFIVSSCTAHHWYSYFRNRRRVRAKETEINMNTCMCAHACYSMHMVWRGCRCTLAKEYSTSVFALINDHLALPLRMGLAHGEINLGKVVVYYI